MTPSTKGSYKAGRFTKNKRTAKPLKTYGFANPDKTQTEETEFRLLVHLTK